MSADYPAIKLAMCFDRRSRTSVTRHKRQDFHGQSLSQGISEDRV